MHQLDHPKDTNKSSIMTLEHIKMAFENTSTQRDLGYFYRKINIQPSLKWFTMTSLQQNTDNSKNTSKNTTTSLSEEEPLDDNVEEEDEVQKFEILSEILNDDTINKEASSGELYYKLACMYFHGQGTTKDDIKAFDYFKIAAYTYQNEQAKHMLDPYSYVTGEDIIQKKINMYQTACTDKDIDLHYKLALIYATGITSNDDSSSSSSSNGKRDSGKAHYYFIIERDYEKAFDYFSKAIAMDDTSFKEDISFGKDPPSMTLDIDMAYLAGLLFYYGKGVEKTILSRASESFEIAANQGHNSAQYYLATVLFEQQNMDSAIEWYKKSMHGPQQQQNSYASYIVGLIYYYYKKESDGDALCHFKHAVELGHEDAQFYLACLYEDQQDYVNALACYNSLSDKNAYACHSLGLFYYYGRVGSIKKDETLALFYFKKAANQGHREAQFYLGKMYRRGDVALTDDSVQHEKAIEWFTAASDQDHAYASYALAILYDQQQDYPKAFDFFKRAAHQGHDRATYRLGKIYEFGKGTDVDLKRAIKWYQRVSHARLNKQAHFRLGVLFYEGGAQLEKNEKKAIYHFKLSARQGHEKAEFNLAKIFEQQQNYEKAMVSYIKSANQNSPEANYTLGFIYYHGKCNQEVDYTKALFHFKRAAEKHHSDAQFYLGKMFEDGDGIQANFTKAVEWYMASKKTHDNVYASYRLGYMYYMGKGMPSDSKKAIHYFHEAAEKRYSDAQFYLGKMYQDGGTADSICSNDLEWDPDYVTQRQEYAGYSIGLNHFTGENGVRQDFERAMHYFRLSGRQGHSDAQYHLGLMYETGTGMKNKSMTWAVKWYTKSAKQYNMNACYQLALIYYLGKEGMEQDHHQSLHYFKIAANQDHSQAQYYLAVMYQNGVGTQVDIKTAVEWYTRAIHLQNMYAAYTLGLLYYNSKGVSGGNSGNKKDTHYLKAMQCFEMAAEQGYSDAYVYLGKIHEDGSGGIVKVDYQKAIACYHQAIDCDQENSFAIYRLGLIYYQGNGIEQDEEKALCYFEWAAGLGRRDAHYYLGKLHDKRNNYPKAIACYSKAIEKKSIHANESLGLLYYLGNGVEQSYPTAYCYLKVAADQGLPTAQFYLGKMHEEGLGLTPSFKEAMDWYIRSAAQKHTEATYRLGLVYKKGKKDQHRRTRDEEGMAVEKDDQKSFSYFKVAAEQGHSDAQYHLGEMYEHISGDYTQSIHWYQLAATQHNRHAAYRLGLLFYEGKHVEQDLVKATRYFQTAADQGHINAKRYTDGIN